MASAVCSSESTGWLLISRITLTRSMGRSALLRLGQVEFDAENVEVHVLQLVVVVDDGFDLRVLVGHGGLLDTVFLFCWFGGRI